MTPYSDEQIEQLLKPINPKRVGHRDGQSHVEAYEIAAHLTRIFGFPPSWRKEITKLECVHESNRPHPSDSKKLQWTVVYRCEMRLWVLGEIVGDDVAMGDGINMPQPGAAHDFAMKTAVSQALKRCAKDLGDQYGLSLYRKGSTGALVGRSLAYERKEHSANQPDVEASAPAWEAEEEPEPEPERHLAAVPDPMYPIGPDTDADASGYTDDVTLTMVDPETGEILPTGPAPAEERSRHPSANVTAAERAQGIEQRAKDPDPPMNNSVLRDIHVAGALLDMKGAAGHELLRAMGNEYLGLSAASMIEWTAAQGKEFIKELNRRIREARRGS